jgi:tRNA modification GTPase
MVAPTSDTIVALATAPGKSGIGVIRLSGAKSLAIAEALGVGQLQPRLAKFSYLNSALAEAVESSPREVIDSGVCLFFPQPNSFTGEDVVEIQAHGSPVTLKRLIRECMQLGARLAEPGEFSQRAFLNGRIDLIQAEAIADLIASGSESAARAATKSLEGVFSKIVNGIADQAVELRKYVEASIDFAEEEIDFLSDGKIEKALNKVQSDLSDCLEEGKRGQKLLDGLSLVILGAPNAGKSSLLNYFSGTDRAIVTDIAGTTRDTLSETIDLDGLAVTITDTAGLNANPDAVEEMGIKRAIESAIKADHLLIMFDASQSKGQQALDLIETYQPGLQDKVKITLVANKIDLSGDAEGLWSETEDSNKNALPTFGTSLKQARGLKQLTLHLKDIAGLTDTEPAFSARTRHIHALESAQQHIDIALNLLLNEQAGELIAEELKLTHTHLQSITGVFTTDDLLGEIFSSFCVGK